MNNPLVTKYSSEKRWVNWRLEERNGKTTKLPFSPMTGGLASSVDPDDWATFAKASDMSDKVGIILKEDKLLLCLDIDHVLENGNIEGEHKEAIAQFVLESDTYVEVSQSTTGLHFFLALTEPLHLVANKHQPFEIYVSGRYIAVTGNCYGEPKEVRKVTPEEALKLLEIVKYPWGKGAVTSPKQAELSSNTPTLSLGDAEVLQRMFNSKNGNGIERLYGGDLLRHNDDASAGDMALLSHLAFWTGKDATQMERIWLNSPLGSREKTQKRKDYRDRTINMAIAGCKEVYSLSAPSTVPAMSGPASEEDEEEQIKTEFIKEKTKSTFHLADYLTRKYSIITIGEKEREMYVYQDGIYFQAENEIIYPEIQRILGEHTTRNAKSETFHKIADMTSYPREVFSGASPDFIPMANGVYNFKTKELLPHSPEYRFTYKFPVVYNADAECPKTLAFFNQVLTDEQMPTIQEWLGYYFYRQYIFKKAIIFVGEGDTGKTTLLEVVTFLLGRKNISSVSLQKMTSDRFSAAHLYEKHGNLVDELSAKDISDTGNFKIATGGGSISGEYKYGNQFSFLNFSKFTFACNKIPDVKDFDDIAYFNRWMVMRFEKTIAKKIPDFIATLTTEEERSGLFNWAMEGLVRLLKQDAFTYGKSAMETKTEMMRSGSSIAVFASEGVVNEPDAEMSKADMYDAYSKFCAGRGLATETIDMFGKKFLFYISYATDGLIYDKESTRGKRVRGWRNVAVVKTPEAVEEEKKSDEEFNKF